VVGEKIGVPLGPSPSRGRGLYCLIRTPGRIAVILVLTAASIAAALIFRLLLKTDLAYSHFMYIPIVLACMWWGFGGMIVAGTLAGLVMGLTIAGLGGGPLWADAVRSAFFLVVAFFIAVLQKRLLAGRRTLDRAQADYRLLIEESLIGIFVFRGAEILFANKRFCAMIGASPEEARGLALSRILKEEDEPRFIASMVGSNGIDLREHRFLRLDGSPIWVQVAGSSTVWEGREAVIVNANDVTSMREAEELARKQEEQLVHSTRLAELGEMAAAISHELNQPLTGIRNYARNAFYMIEKKLGGEDEVKNNLRLISEQVDRASKIINQMRELTRRSDRSFASLDVNGVIRESVDFLMPQMKLSEVEVSLELSPELPQIRGDRIRLAQVFLNLLTNARHAMEGAAVRRLTISSSAANGRESGIMIQVKDTGKGFSEEESRKMFAPFYTTKKSGHGLGLSISRAIVQEHAGTIEASGAPGEGAVFTIRLPIPQRENGNG
jgi:PAS domain S-box-containing protein